MASTYVNDLRLNELATGDASGTWGTITNTNLELVAEAFSFGTEGITTNADTHTSTIADGATDPVRSMYVKYTGTLDSACTITIAPNTVSKLWFIENGTSGSQNIIISQGTGANVTIPAGDTKVVYSDGAGSGAAVVDAFASLSTVDLKVQDDLTVTDDATIGGTLGVTGILTCTDDIIIGDGKTIGSASDVDAMTIASNGQVTFTQTLIGTALDISGDIDVDGTTNLDVVDIDGAVDMASTLQVDGAITNSSTIVSAGKITADAGIDIDNFNIDGTTIALSSGDITIDAAGRIDLSADDNGEVRLFDGSSMYAQFKDDSDNFIIQSLISDADIQLVVNDGGSAVTALTIDSSVGGRVGVGITNPSNNLHIHTDAGDEGLTIKSTGNTSNAIIFDANRSGAGSSIGEMQSKWNGTNVAMIASVTGSDTTNKDDGLLAFYTSSANNLSEAMRVDVSGNLCLGTTSAHSGAILSITSKFNSSSGFTTQIFSSDSAEQFSIRGDGAFFTGLDGVSPYNLTTGNNANAVLTSEGLLRRSTSSLRYKKDIADATWGLTEVKQLRPITFKSNTTGEFADDKTYGGLIAEEVHDIGLTEFVEYNDSNEPDALHYGNMVALLTKAIQEQQTQIEALQSEVNTLKGG